MNFIKSGFSILFVLTATLVFSHDTFVNDNENALFQFMTEKGKRVVIVLEKDNKYISYRFGTEKRIELQFPGDIKDSFKKFRYSFYLRGGTGNEGMDLNYLSFTNGNFKYTVYHEYYQPDDTTSVGIRVENLVDKKETVIKGTSSTIKGSLLPLRDNERIIIENK